MDDDSVSGRRGTADGLSVWGKGGERFADLLRTGGRSPGEPNGYTLSVAVDNGDAVAGSRYAERMAGVHIESLDAVVTLCNAAKDFEGLPFELLLLSTDVRHNVVQDVETGHAWVARARDGLHGSNEHGFDGAKCALESGERDDHCGRRAVGIGNDEALLEWGRLQGLLLGNHREMGWVRIGDDERNMGVLAEIFGIGEDGKVGRAKCSLCSSWSVADRPVRAWMRTDITSNVRI